MAELSWREAIIEVLKGQDDPMHYAEIAQAILDRELKTAVGATPAASAAATISISFSEEGDNSPFVRVSRGYYTLRSPGVTASPEVEAPAEIEDGSGFINAFGMYWRRDRVLWKSSPMLLGQQQPGSTPVDFCGQTGVYLLHDGNRVVYVGRTIGQDLGARLRQHTVDRLNGRWVHIPRQTDQRFHVMPIT